MIRMTNYATAAARVHDADPDLANDEARANYRAILSAVACDGDVHDVSCPTKAGKLAVVAKHHLNYDATRVANDLGVLAKARALLAIAAQETIRSYEARDAEIALTGHVLETEIAAAQAQTQEDRERIFTANEPARLNHTDSTERAKQRYAASLMAKREFERLTRESSPVADLIDRNLLAPAK